MSRPIKFRKWDKDLKRMHVCGEDVHDSIAFGENNEAYYYNEAWYCNLDKDKDCELMQFTELLDRNDKEIYESDDVKFNGRMYRVTWNYGRFIAVTLDDNVAYELHQINDGCEVIGNIYETPLEDTP
ncbi:hypothetical protein A9P44_00465 [Paenibacillus polymyxa]|nr:YopX family protein [Paenibacillus polymyxa]OBA07860.1 hypothetical protein A9P44_00465 [Paenibacillus polymyxa]